MLVVPRVLVGRRDGQSWITEFSHGDGPSAVRAVEPVRPSSNLRYADGLLPVERLPVERWPRRCAGCGPETLDKAALAHDLLAVDDAPLDARFLLRGLVGALPDLLVPTRWTGWWEPPRSC